MTADIKATVFGGGWFTDGTPYGLPLDVLKQRKYFRPPTEEDIAEARQLLAEAGYPNGEGIPQTGPRYSRDNQSASKSTRDTSNAEARAEHGHRDSRG